MGWREHTLVANGTRVTNYADRRRKRIAGAGGTPGGIIDFIIGLLMAVAGAYLLTNQVMVVQQFRPWPGFGWFGGIAGSNPFGLSLLPLLIGIAIVFFNGRSILGWLLMAAGSMIILLGILMNVHLYFRPTSLFNTLLMLGFLAGGLGLMAKAVRPSVRRVAPAAADDR
jgi:hypothetical protein